MGSRKRRDSFTVISNIPLRDPSHPTRGGWIEMMLLCYSTNLTLTFSCPYFYLTFSRKQMKSGCAVI